MGHSFVACTKYPNFKNSPSEIFLPNVNVMYSQCMTGITNGNRPCRHQNILHNWIIHYWVWIGIPGLIGKYECEDDKWTLVLR